MIGTQTDGIHLAPTIITVPFGTIQAGAIPAKAISKPASLRRRRKNEEML